MNDLERRRSVNLRQLLTRSTRRLNERLVAALRTRGYADVRLAHSTVLANLDLSGNTVSEIAARALVPKQAASKLVLELEEMGYLTRAVHELDGRSAVVRFTRRGVKLMRETFDMIADLEGEIAVALGPRRYRALCTSLAELAAEHPIGA
jgi:DNA-binding MarR family transcriptional regulator